MIKFDPKYIKVLGLALSFPSLILSLAYCTYLLVENEIVSMAVGYSIFFIVIFNILWLMIRYALNKKDKP